jgi:mercuric ion binding protein
MKYLFISAIALLILFNSACKKEEILNIATIKSSNIVCDECAQTIKRAVYSLEGIRDVSVDIETKTVVVKYVPIQTNQQTIEITITRAGYDANDRKRDPDAFENLPDCCKQH